MIHTRSALALAAGAALAGGLALPAAAGAAPGAQLPICSAQDGGADLSVGHSLGEDGYLHPVPGQIDVTVGRWDPTFTAPTPTDLRIDWKNRTTGATDHEIGSSLLGPDHAGMWFPGLRTGAGVIEFTGTVTPRVPGGTPSSCTGVFEVK
ncbi:hypothetical protein TPB0596_37570 [Tsukamurella pulmonis]|uniref:Uncharacterized protein n=1 Tax=Tsukamurella pulmonis TaxID=47312 RepID=A0A1H1CFQ5_9ACTN|nr:hypothetical protein [Tsukamurella pulmonis]KXO89937.1 hypothetical protein AXK56_07250 [Tsukamurella pulmonis]KXP11193.1 hypothetical protein AXK57_07495 [Tsukamurella pulmonis]RDH11294.1 hypothetical protein DVB88_13400 [Tsukamurella pulmonis]SDQ62556.1 hypothetical protein SAMN04489765_1166 [Tsukamurella pulmonis]SUP23811.1 Uncharacterised protein [Tsukamurella pulmonis]